jgi:protein-tyrosine phosphatase
MTSILVVCTGNICRSPIAEGLLRAALASRFGSEAPGVSSAGTWGATGAQATREAVIAASERGVAIDDHRARRLADVGTDGADLVIGMAGEHREALAVDHGLDDRAFTLKELVRVLGSLPPVPPGAEADSLGDRVAQAAEARRGGFTGNPLDEDIADPLGLPLQSYRAIAWELDEWIARLVDGLYGVVPVVVTTEG